MAGVFLLIVWAGAVLPFRFYDPGSGLPVPFGDDVADGIFVDARRALNSGNLKEAIALAEHVLELQPAFSSSWLLKAQALEQMGALPSALTSYQQAIAIDPENYEAHL